MSYYTRQQILEQLQTLEIKTVKQFEEKLPAMYLWYTRHKYEIGELPLTYLKRPNNSWTKEKCAEAASQFKHKTDFQKHAKGAYLKALREGFLAEICVHMERKPHVPTNGNVGNPDSKRVDMIGKVFGSWSVLALDTDHERTKQGILYYKCECLECHNIYSVKGALMRNGGSKRCAKCGSKHSHAPQFGQVRTKRTARQSAFHYLHNILKKDAKKRGLVWELTGHDVKHLVVGNCRYCGVGPEMFCQPLKHQGLSQKNTSEATIYRNGIDRVDSALGYTKANTVTACKTCNRAKMEMGVGEFYAWIDRVVKHRNKIPKI